jgi:hypothetical protein
MPLQVIDSETLPIGRSERFENHLFLELGFTCFFVTIEPTGTGYTFSLSSLRT